MSSDPTHDATYIRRKTDIAQIVLSRKRKLCELYAVATSAEPIPKFLDFNLFDSQLAGLASFLEQNDIERGRYLQNSSIPSRNHDVFFNAKPLHASTTTETTIDPTTHSTSLIEATEQRGTLANASSTITRSNEVHSDEANDQLVKPAKACRPVPYGAAKNDKQLKRPATLPQVLIESPVTRRGSHRRPTSPLPDQVRPVSAHGKPSRPESPPYSPGTEPPRSDRTDLEDISSQLQQDPLTNVLTPRRDDQEAVNPSPRKSVAEAAGAFGGSVSMQQPGPGPYDAQLAKSNAHFVESASSPSNTEGPMSTETIKTEFASSATSPEEEAIQPLSREDSEIPTQARVSLGGDHEYLGKSGPEIIATNQDEPTVGPSEVEDIAMVVDAVEDRAAHTTATAGLEDATTRVAASSGTLDLQVVTSPADKDSRARDADEQEFLIIPTPIADEDLNTQESASKRHPDVLNGPTRGEELEIIERLPSTIIDTDMPDRLASIETLPPQSMQTREVPRARKAKKKRKVPMRPVIFSKRSKDCVRHGGVGRHDYFRPFFQRFALKGRVPQLENLLQNTTKSLTTSDVTTAILEDTSTRLLERVRRLQETNRWSFLELRPSPAPPPQKSHWDNVLMDMKWLQTDYQEERKYKLAVAKELARSCAVWVHANQRERRDMQVRVRRPSILEFSCHMPAAGNEQHKGKLDLHIRAGGRSVEFIMSHNSEFFLDSSDYDLRSANPFPTSESVALSNACLDESLLQKLPTFAVSSNSIGDGETRTRNSQARDLRQLEYRTQAETSDTPTDDEPKQILPPERTECALFNPESKPLRTRLNAPWAFKPPSSSMPQQAFYEYRNASQWTWDEDQLLKQYAKDFPSNWPLIADRLTQKSIFPSYIDRRTPWECYERLLNMEGPPADAQARQYLRHFHSRVEKARESFDKQQLALRNHAELQARDGQPVPPVPQKRFPAPVRVTAKSGKKWMVMLDSSRKLARKRETLQNKQQNPSQQDAAQRPVPQRSTQANIHSPQYYSKLKYERDVKEQERIQSAREAQRAMIEAQRRQPGGQQAALANGIGQQIRNGVANGQAVAIGQGAMPAQVRQAKLHPALHMGMATGLPPNAQMAINGRPQANMQNAQRLIPQLNGTMNMNLQDNNRMVQHIQQQRALQQQIQMQQQQLSQNPFGRASPSVLGMNGASGQGMNLFNSTNALMVAAHESGRSPGITQQAQLGAQARASPLMGQRAALSSTPIQGQGRTQPQSLSSGHVPPIVNIQHQIRNQNPNMSPQEVQHYAAEQLKVAMSFSRQNAINAASGVHGQIPSAANGPQSPYSLQHQHQQGVTQQTSSPYQQNGMLASSNAQGRSSSPANPAMMAPVQQQQQQLSQQQQPHSQYSAQMRQQMYNQQRQHQPQHMSSQNGNVNNNGSPATTHASPALAMAIPAFPGTMHRTPSGNGAQQSMRPPSRSATGLDPAVGFGGVPTAQGPQMQRQGSNSNMSQSPRPVSASGFVG